MEGSFFTKMSSAAWLHSVHKRFRGRVLLVTWPVTWEITFVADDKDNEVPSVSWNPSNKFEAHKVSLEVLEAGYWIRVFSLAIPRWVILNSRFETQNLAESGILLRKVLDDRSQAAVCRGKVRLTTWCYVGRDSGKGCVAARVGGTNTLQKCIDERSCARIALKRESTGEESFSVQASSSVWIARYAE